MVTIDFSKMTLREKVLQTFIVTVREINKHGGPEAFFAKYPVGGMYYNYQADTVGTVEIGTGTNLERLAECRAASRLPLLVCADGARVKGQTVDVAYESVAANDSEAVAYDYGKIVGMQMNDNGIDWVLGPCIDMFIDYSMPLFGWGDDADTTARLGAAIVRGIQDRGVCATVKHFPGNGTSNLNMHFGPGQNTLSREEWMNTYGYTYREAFKAGAFSVMTTHTTLESYDSEINEGYYPIATFSKKLTTDLLKGELGFEGAVVTDALIMGGMATGDLIEETVMSFKAGADLLLWPPVEAAERIVELIESGEIPMSRLEDALARIAKMRAFRDESIAKGIADKPDCKWIDSTCERIIKDGICLLRNERELIPIDKSRKRLLIVDITYDGCKDSYLLAQELKERGFTVDVQRDIYDVPSRVCWQDDLDALASRYDTVIFNMNIEYSTAWSLPYMLIWASHLFDKSKKIIINYGSPAFAPMCFPEDPTYIEVNASPSKVVIKALADKLLGEEEFSGKPRLKHPISSIKVFNK